jgi:hypothetical protein
MELNQVQNSIVEEFEVFDDWMDKLIRDTKQKIF